MLGENKMRTYAQAYMITYTSIEIGQRIIYTRIIRILILQHGINFSNNSELRWYCTIRLSSVLCSENNLIVSSEHRKSPTKWSPVKRQLHGSDLLLSILSIERLIATMSHFCIVHQIDHYILCICVCIPA